jgi:hypothetical protein
MPWDATKCTNGSPVFSDAEAAEAVTKADFSKAVFVVISAKSQTTKSAYTYVDIPGWQICVVGHVHRANPQSAWNAAGNSYIPGWNGETGNGWQMKTPADDVSVIGALPEGGEFPEDNRYPQPHVDV